MRGGGAFAVPALHLVAGIFHEAATLIGEHRRAAARGPVAGKPCPAQYRRRANDDHRAHNRQVRRQRARIRVGRAGARCVDRGAGL